ncbi:MAG: LytR C-terminal domain-containing protein [Sporichthyaceae bacterium]
MMRPPGRSDVPRFRPVDTRKRAIGVSVVVATLAGIGAGAWAFGINSEAPPSAGCVREAYTPPPATGGLVNVYNSTQRTGLAIEVADQLRERGFQIGEVGNDPERRKVRGTGELRISKDKDNASARQQKEALQAWEAGMSVTYEKGTNESSVDYVIGERWEGLYPAQQAPPWIELKCIPGASAPQ